jgi:hypothetical protein
LNDLQHVPDVFLHRSLNVVMIHTSGLCDIEVNASVADFFIALPVRERE